MRKYVLVFAALWLSSVFMGCTVVTKKYYVKNEERFAAVDKKMKEHDQAIANLTSSHQNICKSIEDDSRKSANMDANYSKLQASVFNLDSKVETRNNLLDKKIAETKKAIDALEVRMTKKEFEETSKEIERAKIDLQNQLLQLLSQKAGSEQHSETTQGRVNPMIGQKREMPDDELEKEIPSSSLGSDEDDDFYVKRDKNSLQKLLDDALTLYRDEKYKAAIQKWEEVMRIDPENLEAQFIIEIAKEKMKSQRIEK
ncbi:MAG: hypothetical protein AAB332_03260 [Planctomycetota bacterium]